MSDSDGAVTLERATWTLPEMGITVLGDTVVVRPDELDPEVVARDGHIEQRRSGLYVAHDEKADVPEPTVTGTVVGVGPGLTIPNPMLQAWVSGALDAEGQPVPFPTPFVYVPMTVAVGDHIAHSKYGISEVEIAGEMFRQLSLEKVRLKLPAAAAVLQAPTE